MKRIIYVGVASLAIIYLVLVLVGGLESKDKKSVEQLDPKSQQNYEVPDNGVENQVTKALVSKILALTLFTEADLKTMDSVISFKDCDQEEWYYNYVNAAVLNGWFAEDSGDFQPYHVMTESEIVKLFNKVASNYKPMKKHVLNEDQDKPVTYQQFVNEYTLFLKENKEYIKAGVKNVYIFSTNALDQELNEWQVATDAGTYNYGGLAVQPYLDKRVNAIVNGSTLVLIQGIAKEKTPINNVLIEKVEDDKVVFFLGGGRRVFSLNHEGKLSPGNIVDCSIVDGKITEIHVKNNKKQSTIKRVSDKTIELEDGTINFSEDVQIYSFINGVAKYLKKDSLLVGSNSPILIMEKNTVCGAIIIEEPEVQKIRVALNTTGFKGLTHGTIQLTSDTPFVMELGGEVTKYEAGKILVFDEDQNKLDGKRSKIYPLDPKGKIQILSINRGYGQWNRQPAYSGVIEIAQQDHGFSIVNELSVETYLYAVVPSEMPSSYGVEASKVQAVTARSYAYNQIKSNRYREYGAHVDDSVNCQVYNNLPQNPISVEAVDATKDQVLMYNHNIVSANFFSTSCGFTANSGEVWADSGLGVFPNKTPEYLSATAQSAKVFNADLTLEEQFFDFIAKKNPEDFDSDSPWYRWKVSMTMEQIENSVNKNIASLYNSKPYLIRTLNKNNIFRSMPVTTIGKLKDLHVYKRGEGGNIMEMVLEGSEATVKVSTEYYIRQLITPVEYDENKEPILLTLQDGSTKENYKMLPSTFFTPEKIVDTKGNIVEIRFTGGGFGHGVGMSQNGVKGMVDRGYAFEDILKHYYKNIVIGTLAE